MRPSQPTTRPTVSCIAADDCADRQRYPTLRLRDLGRPRQVPHDSDLHRHRPNQERLMRPSQPSTRPTVSCIAADDCADRQRYPNTQTSRPWSISRSSTREQASPTSTKPGTTDETKPAIDQINGKLHRGSRLSRAPLYPNTQTSRPWSTSTSSVTFSRHRPNQERLMRPSQPSTRSTVSCIAADDCADRQRYPTLRLRDLGRSREVPHDSKLHRHRPNQERLMRPSQPSTRSNGKLHRLRRAPVYPNTQTSRPWSTREVPHERHRPNQERLMRPSQPSTSNGKLHRGSD